MPTAKAGGRAQPLTHAHCGGKHPPRSALDPPQKMDLPKPNACVTVTQLRFYGQM